MDLGRGGVAISLQPTESLGPSVASLSLIVPLRAFPSPIILSYDVWRELGGDKVSLGAWWLGAEAAGFGSRYSNTALWEGVLNSLLTTFWRPFSHTYMLYRCICRICVNNRRAIFSPGI